jgi:hypothetical protein
MLLTVLALSLRVQKWIPISYFKNFYDSVGSQSQDRLRTRVCCYLKKQRKLVLHVKVVDSVRL